MSRIKIDITVVALFVVFMAFNAFVTKRVLLSYNSISFMGVIKVNLK